MTAAPNRIENQELVWQRLIRSELEIVQGISLRESTPRQKFVGVVGVLKELLARDFSHASGRGRGNRKVHCLATKFEFGQMLRKNLEAHGLWSEFESAIRQDSVTLPDLLLEERDGLFDPCGALARSSALLLESIGTEGLNAVGYSLLDSSPLVVGVPGVGCCVDDAWLIPRFERNQQIPLYGELDASINTSRDALPQWIADGSVYASAFDVPIAGANSRTVVPLRLYCLELADEAQGAERTQERQSTSPLQSRLVATYSLVACALRDILDGLSEEGDWIQELVARSAIRFAEEELQIAVPELIRLLMIEKRLKWDEALDVAQQVFVSTPAHSQLSLADHWGVDLVHRVLPLHLEIARQMGSRGQKQRASCDLESSNHAVVAPKRWLRSTNPALCTALSNTIGEEWLQDDRKLSSLSAYRNDAVFGAMLRRVKQENKLALTDELLHREGRGFDPRSLVSTSFPVAGNPKAGLLTALYIAHLYLCAMDDEFKFRCARTFLVVPAADLYPKAGSEEGMKEGTKGESVDDANAASDEALWFLTLELLDTLRMLIRNDSRVSPWLTLIFLPGATSALVDRVVAATDLGLHCASRDLDEASYRLDALGSNGALSVGPAGGNSPIGPGDSTSTASYDFLFGDECADQADVPAQSAPSPFGRVMRAIEEGRLSPANTNRFLPLVGTLSDHPAVAWLGAVFDSYTVAEREATDSFIQKGRWSSAVIERLLAEAYSSDCAVRDLCKRDWIVG